MERDRAIEMFGVHWAHRRQTNLSPRSPFKRFDIADHKTAFVQALGPAESFSDFETLEEARIGYATELMDQARTNVEEIEELHRRFFGVHPIMTPARLIHDLIKRNVGLRRERKAELHDIRKHTERILDYESPEKLAADLEQLTNVTIMPLEADVSVPEPVYGRGEHDVILYQVNVPYYITQASSYWIQECRIVEVDVISRRYRGEKGYDLRYLVKPLVEAPGDENRSVRKSHKEIHDLVTGKVDSCGTGLYGRSIFFSAEKALDLINETKARAIEDLQKDVAWYARPSAA